MMINMMYNMMINKMYNIINHFVPLYQVIGYGYIPFLRVSIVAIEVCHLGLLSVHDTLLCHKYPPGLFRVSCV